MRAKHRLIYMHLYNINIIYLVLVITIRVRSTYMPHSFPAPIPIPIRIVGAHNMAGNCRKMYRIWGVVTGEALFILDLGSSFQRKQRFLQLGKQY